MNKRNTMTQKTPKKSKLEKDSEGKPRIILSPLEKIVVNTSTQEKYNILMQVYECGGWRWWDKDLPTWRNKWDDEKEKTCIQVESGFGYSSKKYYRRNRYKVISTKKFYNMQNVTPDMLREINSYFETKK